MSRLVWLLIPVSVTACLNGPSFFKQPSASLAQHGSQVSAAVVSDDSGVLTASVSAASGATQVVGASSDSAIAGSNIAFPPGALAVDTNVVVQEGVPLATDSFSSDVGLDSGTQVQAASGTVVVQSTVPMDTATPFTVAIQLSNSNLKLDDAGTYYAIFYKVYVASSDSYVAGVIPNNAITVKDGKVSFQTTHFGAYQVVATPVPITTKKEVASTTPIVTMQQAQTAPLVLDNVSPYAVPGGATVTLTGKNFRPTMTIALGTRSISDIKVMSDVSASFVMPKDVSFGFTNFTVAQDGAVENHKLFALADKTGLPLITMDPSGVCAGVNYYDANGNKATGTKVCNSTVALPPPQGPDIPVASTLQIPATGVFFRVVGSGTVHALSPMPVGTKITLQMVDTVTFVDNETSPKLMLKAATMGGGSAATSTSTSTTTGGDKPYSMAIDFYPGDLIELTSLGNGDWAQTTRGPSPVIFYAEMDSAGMPSSTFSGGACTGTWDSALDDIAWSKIYVNSGSVYDPATRKLTLPAGGQYLISFGGYAEFGASASIGEDCNFYIYQNGSQNFSSYGSVAGGTNACTTNPSTNTILNGGNYFEFKFQSRSCDTNTATIKSTAATRTFVIVRGGNSSNL